MTVSAPAHYGPQFIRRAASRAPRGAIVSGAGKQRPVHFVKHTWEWTELARSVLRNEGRFGIQVHGENVGRFGPLPGLIGLHFHKAVVLVDGTDEQLVKNVCSGLCSDMSIVKVVHDLPDQAACLLHKYGIELSSVYDLQVEEKFRDYLRPSVATN